MKTTLRFATALALAVPVLLARPAQGGDWPSLGRDGTRNAVSPEKGAPTHWQVEEKQGGRVVRPARNIKWEAQLGTGNFASPVVAGGLVWVGTNNDRPRDAKLQKDAAVLMCFRERDGKFLWQYVSPRLVSEDEEDWSHASLNNSPLAEGDRLYLTTNRAEVLCFDVGALRKGEGTPRLRWKLDMRKDLGVRPRGPAMNMGLTCSIGPSYKGRLFVSTNNGRTHAGKVLAPKAPALVCLDRDTGKVIWSDCSPGNNVIHSQWSSPLVTEVEDRGQVVAAQGDGWVRSFDALTGKLLWKFDGNPKKATPYKNGGGGERCFFTATPVLYEKRIYLGVGQEADDGPGVGHLWCIDLLRATARGKLNKDHDVSPVNDNFDPKAAVNKDSALAWHYGGPVLPAPKGDEREIVFGRTLSSVAVHDGLVIAPELAGYVHCLDARTGRPYWVHDAENSIVAAPLIADGKVYVSLSDGVTVLSLAKALKVLGQSQMGSALSAPVFANGVLYQVAGLKLYAIEAGKAEAGARAPGHWPRWRGPDRLNVSADKGLLATWPKDGPPLAWQVTGIGEGVGSVAVAAGKVYVLGHRGTHEHLTAVEEVTGKPLWSVPLGPATKEMAVMRWLSQRTPLVDADRAYAVTARGELVCVRVANGQVVWRKDYAKDFEGRRGHFGVCDQLLVDGDRLICVPGGKTASVVALNKRTGGVVWKCPLGDGAAYVGAVLVGGGGVRKHYVAVTARGLVGVSTEGKELWRSSAVSSGTANGCTPNMLGNKLFCAGNYGQGVVLLELADKGDGVEVKEVYRKRLGTPSWHEMALCLGEHAYVGANGGINCLKLDTGEVVWQEKRSAAGRPPYSGTCADGHLVLRTQQGGVLLVEATPRGHVIKGAFQVPGAKAKPGSTAPVVTGGRLYVRDEERLLCYDVRKNGKPGKPTTFAVPAPAEERLPGKEREPGAIYVPTPQHVVEKMLELAKVKKAETVVDLGCGDGRIVVTAARKYGCKAVGYDIDPECVKMSQENVKKHKVEGLVTIERKDLFAADLSKTDVVALYLPPRMMERLLPQLGRLPAGSRIVSHAFAIPGLVPELEVKVVSGEDRLEHKVFLYVTPLKKAKGKE